MSTPYNNTLPNMLQTINAIKIIFPQEDVAGWVQALSRNKGEQKSSSFQTIQGKSSVN